MDECSTLPHCSESLSILGSNYLCPSTNTCIPYYFHCSKEEYRCPNRSDDRLWCSRQHRPSNCSGRSDFVCFDGRCAQGGRCDRYLECTFGEDEYMCDYPSSLSNNFIGSRKLKRSSRGKRPAILRFSRYPLDVNITQSSSIVSTVDPPITSSPNPFISSASLYMCNRGVGILLTRNHGLVACFCPPQYSGNKCQLHADRVSVILHVDLSQLLSLTENDQSIVLKLVILFLFNSDEVLMRDQFHLHPPVELDSFLKNNKKTKLISHFLGIGGIRRKKKSRMGKSRRKNRKTPKTL